MTTNVALAAAVSVIGKPYVFDTPLNPLDPDPDSFDCSGLTMWAWRKAGLILPHQSGQQYNLVKHRPLAQALPGDIVFYIDSLGRCYHCAIYAGSGQMIEAPHTKAFVIQRAIWGTPAPVVGIYAPVVSPPPAPPAPPAPPVPPTTYVVKSGDNLSRIAALFATTWQQLVTWNKAKYPSLATNPNAIDVGWTLVVRA